MKTKAKGRRNEYKSIRYLEAQGYVCTKAGGSLGVWDIIGISENDVVLVQVKSNDWYISKEERQRMADFKVPQNCRKVLHRWHDYDREPEIYEI